MAKISKTVSLKNATICMDDMTITEYMKDDTKTYDLKNLLNEWNGIDGISLTIRQDNEMPTDK